MTPEPAAADGEQLSPEELRDAWPALSSQERAEGLKLLPRDVAEDLFFSITSREQAEVILDLPQAEQRSWMRALAPDDAADLLQELPVLEERERLMGLLDDQTRREVQALLAYREDHAGGLMSPRFARLRADMTADQAVTYLRRQTRQSVEMPYYAYVLDAQQRLLGVVSFRELMAARGDLKVGELMHTDVRAVDEQADQEAVARLFRETGLIAIPVLDSEKRMKGIVTVDDIVEVVSEEATEDIQKLGGSESLGEPYLTIALQRMIKKRAGWLAALFLGEMLTATAMGVFEKEIDKAVVLALFVPLIISSGGNSGSQATSLVIRAMALGELRLRDWYRVIRRELLAGLALGSILGSIGLARILLWQGLFHTYGEHYMLVGLTVALSLIGVVTFGTMAGSLLPFVLRRLGFDPASASAPFVATLVDVTGLIIYFTTASAIMRGTLL
ncbi:MAG TPA: magnesium transporter [Myxococcales bacterium]|jgi:magnesium transporter|nr:magnesium transporter [Myxococcales bacterium]